MSLVKQVLYDGNDVFVRIDRPLEAPATSFHCEIDSARRHLIMRTHTAFHVLAAVLGEGGSMVTGCQLEPGRGRGDFTATSAGESRDAVERANALLSQDHEVRVEWVSRKEFQENPELLRLATDLVPDVDPVRLINIVGVDRQADGGTHVRNTLEVGHIVHEKFENKGARNKRITFSIA